ncbi:MAG: 3-phosphoglycerate dehydrogenase [Bacteroidales bacterium]|jgi:D-3-phosphoglycerate dehydrogenase|nr:3-phosphoglycerate dehydrogenase [Bacteroidales bacterium]
MKKILVATDKPFDKKAVEEIKSITESAGYKFALLEKYTEKAQLLDAVKDANAIIIRSDIIDREVIEAAKNLEIVVRAGAGYDNIDLAAATEHNVVAMNTPGQNSNAVAELVLGMMVYMARGCFDGKTGSELLGKKLGIHAYGNVGKNVARIAKGFGMEVFAFDPYVNDADMVNDGVIPVKTVKELYSECNYVSLHIPANDQTKKSIGKELLMSMPANATLVNTARKEVINEDELLEVYANRPDFKYVSDIEPACKEEIAAKYDGRYFFTPKKMGAQTKEANINAGLAAAHQIVDFFKTGNKKFQVNK